MVLLILHLGWTCSAEAQWGSDFLNPRRVLLTPDQVEAVAERVGLDADQRAVADALIGGYLAAHQERIQTLNTIRAEEANSSGSEMPDDERRAQAIEHWRERLRVAESEYEARKQLKADLQLIMRDEQLPQWERFWRDHRRWTLLPRYSFRESTIDLVAIRDSFEDDEFTSTDEIDQLLSRYVNELDSLIRAYHDHRRESLHKHFEEQIARLEGTWRDPLQEAAFSEEALSLSNEEFEAFNERIRALGNERRIKELAPEREAERRIRDCNLRFFETLTSLLPAEQAAVFRRKYFTQTYAEYFDRPDARMRFHGHAYIDRAMALENLNDEQRKTIESVGSQYVVRFEAIADQLVRLQRKEEDEWKSIIRESTPYGEGPTKMQIEKDRAGLLEERRELQESAIATIRAILTPEQQAEIAEPEERTRLYW